MIETVLTDETVQLTWNGKQIPTTTKRSCCEAVFFVKRSDAMASSSSPADILIGKMGKTGVYNSANISVNKIRKNIFF
jgi:hypothetical protein